MNKTSQEILDEYKIEFRELENNYHTWAGHYPGWDEWEFWGSYKVQRTDALLQIWWDLSEILSSTDINRGAI